MKNEELQIGKEAICVDGSNMRRPIIIAGRKYILHGLMPKPCGCSSGYLVLAIPDIPTSGTKCGKCGIITPSINGMSWFRASRFRPLNAIDALMDKLESEPKEELIELIK